MSRKRLRPWLAAGIAMLAVTSNAIVTIDVANADVCAGVGRRISVSGCTNVADTINGYVPPPADYAPLPGDFRRHHRHRRRSASALAPAAESMSAGARRSGPHLADRRAGQP